MNYLKENIPKGKFSIKDFYAELGTGTKADSDKAFKSIIHSICLFKKTPKNKPLISFANAIQKANFGVLESEDAYDYWTVAIENRNLSKRVYARASKENEVLNEVLNPNKKIKTIVEDVAVEANTTGEQTDRMSAKSFESSNTSRSSANIWLAWSIFIDLFLSGNLNDTDVNDYSLEYLGIITLGDKVGNKQTRASYPKDLVATTNKHLSMAKQDVFLKFDSKYNTFFSALEVSVDNCHTVLLRNSLAVKNTNDPSLSFCYEYFMIFVLHVFTKCGLKRISKSESAYNFRVIFRFMDVVVDALPQCEFMPGEVRLQAIKDELERQDLSTASYYNADGIIYDLISGVELMLLETSGPFGNNDIKRETKDYVKAAYGLLAMLHKIARKYVYADIDIFKQLKVCFVHAANNKIRLWAFCLVSKQLYILNRIDSSVLPTDSSNAENDLKGMTNLFWKLKQTIEEATETLKKIKESHEKNKIFAEENPDSQIEQLISYLVEVAEVKLSSQISYAEDIYINSSPIIPDSLDFD